MKTWEEKEDFKALLLSDPEISKAVTPDELEECFDVTADLKNIDVIYERVFS